MKFLFAALFFCLASLAQAQGNLEIDTPAIAAVKAAMQGRFPQLEPHFASGALGLTGKGLVELRDANAVPLAQRPAVTNLVAAENKDRATLYREIAKANNHPEWEGDIAHTFGGRWIDRAKPSWWVQDAGGGWKKK